MTALGASSFVSQHLAHLAVFGGFGLATAVVLVWPTRRDEPSLRPGEVEPSRDRSALQVACLGLCAAAATHFAVMPAHFRQSWLYGAFFLCAATAQLVLAGAVLVHPTRPLLTAVLAGSLAVVVLWTVSRFVGIPIGPDNGATEQIGALDVLATLAEVATALACLVVLRTGLARPAWRWSAWTLPLRLALLAASIGVPLAAAVAPKG